MQLYRTRGEAVLESSPQEREQIRAQLNSARTGDRFALEVGDRVRSWEHWSAAKTLTVCISNGRGFNAYWESEVALRVNVGEEAVTAFSEAFAFPAGAHVHYDPPAFPEERNDTSVELIIQDAPSEP
jgi:hypothetical protein